MSHDLILQANMTPQAWDPTPRSDSLAACHVPFEALTGQDLEGQLVERLRGYDRIALTGPIGCGKSSLARYVVRRSELGLAPIFINVATERRDQISEVHGFLQLLVSQILSRANAANSLNDDQRRKILRSATLTEDLGVRERRAKAEIGADIWVLKPGIAREVTRTVRAGEAPKSVADARQAVRDAMQIIVGNEMTPVLIADDTDRLLNAAADPTERERLFDGFFGEVLREISDYMECGLLVAAQDTYLERPGYRDMTEGVLAHVPIPELTAPGQLQLIITARVQFVDPAAAAGDLITPDAVELLHELYHRHDRSLRKTLQELREALAFAAEDHSDLIELRHIQAAAAGV